MKIRLWYVFSVYSVVVYAEDDNRYCYQPSVEHSINLYGGIDVPIPTSLLGFYNKYLNKYLNIIDNETTSSHLSDEEKKNYLVFPEISKYNTEKQSSINDCIKFKDDNILNNLAASYKDDSKKDKICKPFFTINMMRFFIVKNKIDEYINRETECKHGLYGLSGEQYYNQLNNEINKLDNPDNDDAKLDLLRLKQLKQKHDICEILKESKYNTLFKKLTIIPFHIGGSYTYYFNNSFGIGVDISCSYLCLNYTKTICLSEFSAVKSVYVTQFIFEKCLSGNIIDRQALSYLPRNLIGLFGRWNIFANYDFAINNYFRTCFFDLEPETQIGFYDIGFRLHQINPTLKINFVFNVNDYYIITPYSEPQHILHQIIVSPGVMVNINFFKLNLDFTTNKDCFKEDKTILGEYDHNKQARYNNVKDSYNKETLPYSLFQLNNFHHIIDYLEKEFISRWKIRPLLEVKYRFQHEHGFSFEIGTTLVWRSFFNIDINKKEMLNYWNSINNNNADYDRKDSIIKNINDFGIPWCLNFDMRVFISVGYNFIL